MTESLNARRRRPIELYDVSGWAIAAAYVLACAYFAPRAMGPWVGVAIGAVYFVACWFVGGVYLSCVVHMGIAHRALDFRRWFVIAITIVNNTFGVYVNPVTWVNRHRLHHKHSDHPGDPNKLASDGFWRTLYLCLMPYACQQNLANDEILRSLPFRFVSNWPFAIIAQTFNFWLLCLAVGKPSFAAVLWVGFRVFTLWINMIMNYWTHDRRFGYRPYDDDHDNAMNVGEWLPVTVTMSACLQNNHHHAQGLLRLSHGPREYDPGFAVVKVMKALGLVRATLGGTRIPNDVPLTSLDF